MWQEAASACWCEVPASEETERVPTGRRGERIIGERRASGAEGWRGWVQSSSYSSSVRSRVSTFSENLVKHEIQQGAAGGRWQQLRTDQVS